MIARGYGSDRLREHVAGADGSKIPVAEEKPVMRPTTSLLVIGLFALPVATASAQLVNPSFENGLTGWTLERATLGTDFNVYTQEPGKPNAPDGTRYAGVIKPVAVQTSGEDPIIWQAVTVANPQGKPVINVSLDFYVASYANGSGDPDSQIEVSVVWQNNGQQPDPLSPPRVMDLCRVSHRYTGDDNDSNPWRRIKVAGTIPDKPGTFILRIKFVHNDDTTQENTTLIDNVVFSATPGDRPAPPATNLLNNGDFETAPYNQTYDPYNQAPVVPAGWFRSADGQGDDGPTEGFTNGQTSPTNPLGVSTTNGTHFYGAAKPATSNNQPKMTLYQVVNVANFNSCARAVRYKLHMLSHNSVTNNPDPLDHSGNEVRLRWISTGDDILNPLWVEPWALIAQPNVRYCDNNQTQFTAVDVSGEIETIDGSGNPIGVKQMLLEIRINTWRPPSEGHIFRAMIDDVRLELEAVGSPTGPSIFTESPLPAASCGQNYNTVLTGCGAGTLTWTLDSGSLPLGLDLASDGTISGIPLVGGAFQFVVKLTDSSGSATRPLAMTVGGVCCNNPPADFDGDGDVDQDDFGMWQLCVTDTNGGVPDGCGCMDLDKDGLDVDQADYTIFSRCAGGAFMPPACP